VHEVAGVPRAITALWASLSRTLLTVEIHATHRGPLPEVFRPVVVVCLPPCED
jgi:hypothetical protein